MTYPPLPSCPGRHCGCQGMRYRDIPAHHRVHPVGGTVRVWMLAKFFDMPSATLAFAINEYVEGLHVRSPASSLSLSNGDFGLLLSILALYMTPVMGLNPVDHALLDTGETYADHLVSNFWMHRRLSRMEVST